MFASRWHRHLVLLGLVVGNLLAQTGRIPEAEALNPPTPARLATVLGAARRDGWAPQVAGLRAAALEAYAKEKWAAAESWNYVYRWAALFGQRTVSEYFPRWVQAVNALKVGHSNMAPIDQNRPDQPLGLAVAPELQAWLLGTPAFSEAFFSLLSDVDYVPAVLQILNELHQRDPAKFKTYQNLALAIAVVHDVPPPPRWPHGQVTESTLPRRFPAPAELFAWLIREEQLGHAYHRLARLGADELKFVVDLAAPLPELEWARTTIRHPLAQLASVYSMIRYRHDRVAAGVAVWPGPTYRLEDILKQGGICADQAYFATEVGKGRGVPTLLFYGAGNAARHAWFGYLDGDQRWRLDAGRYAEQRFVTGLARDPQTWREFSDHELQFLSERFRFLPAYRQSRIHASFAAEYLAAGQPAVAASAARKAANAERRNPMAWEILLLAAQREGRDARTMEGILREAAVAFQRYPDLEAGYLTRVAASLRARGETSAAEAELKRIARKNEGERIDLSVQQARNLLLGAMQTQPLPEQLRAYYSILENFGRGAGMAFFDQVVTVFVEHLTQLQQSTEASRALERARQALKVEPGSQLEKEISRLAEFVKRESRAK